jgi:hypothetical protein
LRCVSATRSGLLLARHHPNILRGVTTRCSVLATSVRIRICDAADCPRPTAVPHRPLISNFGPGSDRNALLWEICLPDLARFIIIIIIIILGGGVASEKLALTPDTPHYGTLICYTLRTSKNAIPILQACHSQCKCKDLHLSEISHPIVRLPGFIFIVHSTKLRGLFLRGCTCAAIAVNMKMQKN